MIRTHNRPLPPWVLWAGVLVSGGLTTLLFCYFDWPRHIVLMLLAAAVLLFLFKNALEERDRRVCVTGAVLGGVDRQPRGWTGGGGHPAPAAARLRDPDRQRGGNMKTCFATRCMVYYKLGVYK